jgi:hypothetical protein
MQKIMFKNIKQPYDTLRPQRSQEISGFNMTFTTKLVYQIILLC